MNLSILLSLVLEWSLHPSWVHVICPVIFIPSLIPVFQTHDLARIDAKVHRIFVEKFEIQILIKVVLPHRSFLNHLRIQFWCIDLESSNWNNYWKWVYWKVPGQIFLGLNLLTLRSIHSLGSYPWGPWSASACPQKTTWRKMPLKNVFPTGGNHQHSNQVESKSWRKETVELALFVLPCDVRSVLRVCSN